MFSRQPEQQQYCSATAEWEQMDLDVLLASVEVSVTDVMLTQLKSFPQNVVCPNVCNNEINGGVPGRGTSQCLNDIFKELCLPKFTDCEKQYVVYFLDDLKSYFLTLYAPCIILQYAYKPTRCTKFL